MWFPTPLDTSPPDFPSQNSRPTLSQIPIPDHTTNSTELPPDLTDLTPIVSSDLPTFSPPPTPSQLHSSILSSTDKLFFVSYADTGTIRPRWYLVQVDLDQTLCDPRCSDHQSSGHYYCHFFARHPSDTSNSDIDARWWPE